MEKDRIVGERRRQMAARKKKSKKEKQPLSQTLSYPLVVRSEVEVEKKIAMIAKLAREVANYYLPLFYNEKTMELLAGSGKKAYKELESLLMTKNRGRLPSRIRRGILEVVGRTLRTMAARKDLYKNLLSLGKNPKKWNYRKLINKKGVYAKAEYVRNLAEQTQNYINNYGYLPANYYELQECPKLKQYLLSYAPDDGQAISLHREEDQVKAKFKVLAKVDENREKKLVWEWVAADIPLPNFLQEFPHLSPDLRYVCIHGQYRPVLDYKVEVPCEPYHKTERFLTVDWGTKKLVTVCIFDRDGNQISPPIFLKFTPLLGKLLRIRKEIDKLKAKRDRLPHKHSKWYKYNREIAKKWRKYRAINTALAHLASNAIVLIAKLFDCSDIYVEWLKGLKSKKCSADLNWVINTTVRQKIFDLVDYKAKIVGVKLNKPLPPSGTSQYCPKCGARGYHAPASNRMDEKVDSGSWFVCPSCHYNADRDFVACCNLARKVLYGNALKNQTKVVAYMATSISDLLSRQSDSSYGKRLLRNLKGWLKNSKKDRHKHKSRKVHHYSTDSKHIGKSKTIVFCKKFHKRHTVFLSHHYLFASSLKS